MDWTIVSFGLAAAFSAVLIFLLWRGQNASKPDDAGAQLEARLDGMFKLLAAGQSRLADSVNERLDSVSSRRFAGDKQRDYGGKPEKAGRAAGGYRRRAEGHG
jgi:hypothetical protein